MLGVVLSIGSLAGFTGPLRTGGTLHRAGPISCEHRFPRHIAFAPSATLGHKEVKLAALLDEELGYGLEIYANKQRRLVSSELSMAKYVSRPSMVSKAEELEKFSQLILTNRDRIPSDASTAVVSVEGSATMVVLQFDRIKYGSPREEALAHLRMARKLRRQQSKVDVVRHQNEGIEAALAGWRKRVRLAAARGEAAAVHVLKGKLLDSSQRLGLSRLRRRLKNWDDVGI